MKTTSFKPSDLRKMSDLLAKEAKNDKSLSKNNKLKIRIDDGEREVILLMAVVPVLNDDDDELPF